MFKPCGYVRTVAGVRIGVAVYVTFDGDERDMVCPLLRTAGLVDRARQRSLRFSAGIPHVTPLV
jgi:hypothetical protein